MTTPEHDDPVAIERDDALLDAIASGASVDDPAGKLLAEIARAAEEQTPGGGSAGEGGGGRRIRTIWGVTLGVSIALVLGSGVGVAAYGQLAPHAGGMPGIDYVVPGVPSASPGLGSMSVTVSPRPDPHDHGRDAGASYVTPDVSGLPPIADAWPWQLARYSSPISRPHDATSDAAIDPTRPFAINRWAEPPRTYSAPIPRFVAPTTYSPWPAPAPVPATTGDTRYVPAEPPASTATPTGVRTAAPAPSESAAPSSAHPAADSDAPHGRAVGSRRGRR